MLKKDEIRSLVKGKRSMMNKEEVLKKSRQIERLFLKNQIYRDCKYLMSYMPLGNEVDVTGISKQAMSDRKKLAVPVTDKKTCEIAACDITSESEFKVGAFSVLEPTIKQTANAEDIDVILVPGIAFDKSGTRIGFGKGCYDRFLKNSKAVKVGVCYEFQMCDRIECEDYDVKVDFLITENGIIACDDRKML